MACETGLDTGLAMTSLTACETGPDISLAIRPSGHLSGHLAHGTSLDMGLAMTSPITCETGLNTNLAIAYRIILELHRQTKTPSPTFPPTSPKQDSGLHRYQSVSQ